MSSFTRRLAEEAEAAGLSLAELGRRTWPELGEGARKAQRLAAGDTVATVEDAAALARTLGLDRGALLRPSDDDLSEEALAERARILRALGLDA